MSNEELEARERIIQATIDILNENSVLEEITVRQIAKHADVGTGLINYHFQTKENLLQAAVSRAGGEVADQWENTLDPGIQNPVERLKSMLKANAAVATANVKFATISIRYELMKGEMSVCLVLLPVLREIFGSNKTDQDLKIISFMLVSSMQLLFIRDRAFKKYSGIDISNPLQRDLLIDSLVDSLFIQKG